MYSLAKFISLRPLDVATGIRPSEKLHITHFRSLNSTSNVAFTHLLQKYLNKHMDIF
jgi:hypothetical protein